MNIFDIPIKKRFYSYGDKLVHSQKYVIYSMNKVSWGWKPGDIITYYNDGNRGKHFNQEVFVKIAEDGEYGWNPKETMINNNIILTEA